MTSSLRRHITMAIVSLLPLAAAIAAPPPEQMKQQPKALSFIENNGQITDQHGKRRPDIDYKLETPGMNVFIGDGQLHYQWYEQKGEDRTSNNGLLEREYEVKAYRMDVILVGANKQAERVEEAKQDQTYNYYLEQCPGGATANTFNRLTYKNVYPNIDWVLYIKDGTLKYDFVVHAGGKISDIKLQYVGADNIEIQNGKLIASTPMGHVTEESPFSFAKATGKEIPSNFILQGNTLSFRVAPAEGDIVIDPALQWATYFGGSGTDYIMEVTADTPGNALVCGYTSSSSNIATSGAHQTSFAGNSDAFIAKFSKTGTLTWATYYGVSGNQHATGITTNLTGDVYVAGPTNAVSGLATSGAFQTTPDNGFILKLNGSGVRQWCTYYPGLYENLITCDLSGNVYVTGQGSTGMATTGAYITTMPLGQPGFLAKFNSSGARQWCTFYPADIAGLACDPSGNVIVSGTTFSSSGIATTGAHQTTFGGIDDAFIGKFSSSGSYLWGTYYGGSSYDRSHSLAIDNFGNIYIGGVTSSGGMATTGAFQTTRITTASNGIVFDGLLAKFNSSGTRQWSTYFFDRAHVTGLAIGYDGNLYASGVVYASPTGFTTTGAYQSSGSGSDDLFLASFSMSGSRLYTTYFGGSLGETTDQGLPGYREAMGLGSSPNGKIYFAGSTKSSGLATTGAHQTSHGGGTWDGILAQVQTDQMVYIENPTSHTQYCIGDSIKVSFGVTQPFNSSNTFTLQMSDASGSFATPTTIGSSISSTGGGIFKAVVPFVTNGTGYRIRIVASNPSKTSLDNGVNIAIANVPVTPIATSNAPICSGNTLTLGSTTNSTGATYSWIGPNSFISNVRNTSITNASTAATGNYIISAELNGCVRKDTISVVVNPGPDGVTANSNSPVCSGVPLNFTATSSTSGVTYSWSGPGFSSGLQNPTLSNPQIANSGTFTVTVSLGNCSTSVSTVVAVNQSPTAGAYVSPGDTICTFSTATFVGFAVNAGTPTFQWYKNGTPIPGATNNTYTSGGFVNGDQMQFEIKGNTGCNQPVLTPPITLTVTNQTVTPTVSLLALPGTNIRPGTLVTFTATVMNGGPTPKFQWKKNGNNVGGNIASYTDNLLMPGDAVTVEVISNHACAQPANVTAAPLYIWWPLSVADHDKNTTVSLYPNPNKGSFTIDGVTGSEVRLSIVNVLGQVVYNDMREDVKGSMGVDARLVPGAYLLRIVGDGTSYTLRFTVE